MFRILHSISCFEAENHKMKEQDLSQLWVAESFRTLVDRVKDEEDVKIFDSELQMLARKYFREVPHNRIGQPFYSHFCQQSSDTLIFKEVERIKSLRPIVENFIEEYNDSNRDAKINTPMFDFMIEKLIQIHRAIQQPFSNVILIGVKGLGKFQLSRLAIHVASYKRQEISSTRVFDKEEWKMKIKTMINLAILQQQVSVINIQENQITKDVLLADLNCILKNGFLPDLKNFKEETEMFKEMQKQVLTEQELAEMKDDPFFHKQMQYLEQVNRVKRNFKCILNLTPNGIVLNKKLKNYLGVVNSSTLIWMDNWPTEGFREVGKLQLQLPKNCPQIKQKDKIIEMAIKMHYDIQEGIQEYEQMTGHKILLTPCTYQNLLSTIKELFKTRDIKLHEEGAKYKMGFDMLLQTERLVFKIQEEMQLKSPMLVMQQRQVEDVLKELDTSTNEMELRVQYVEEEEKSLLQTKTDAEKIRDMCERQFGEAVPLLKKAIKSLKKLSKGEITELKSIKKPTPAVYTLMKCVCILMDVPPERVKLPGDKVQFDYDYWGPSVSKKVLNNFKIVEVLPNYSPESMNQEIMIKLDKATKDGDFNLENIKKACKAAQGIYHWLLAMQNYYFVYTECKPKRDALLLADRQITVHENEIQERKGQLGKLQDKLIELKLAYKEKESSVRQLQKDIDECNIQKTRAAKLLNALSGEKQKWTILNKMIIQKISNLEGDCFLAAALMIYLGQLNCKYREEFFYKWMDEIREQTEIRISEYWDFVKLFGDQITIKKWIINKLPSDSFSLNNAVIVDLCPLQSIIIDPQFQASSWLKEINKDELLRPDLTVLTTHNARFVPIMAASIKYGKKVLIENTGDELNRDIYPLFDKSMLQDDGYEISIYLRGIMIPIHKDFKLYVTSELKNPRFSPDIAVYANFINFSVTQEGLEAQLLSQIVSHKIQKLEKSFEQIKVRALECIIRLQNVEELILKALSNEIEYIIKDDKLIEHLAQSSIQSKKVTLAFRMIKKQEQELIQNRSIFQSVAQRGALLFFIVNDLSKVNNIYQFSLKWFFNIFDAELKNKEVNQNIDPLVDIQNRLTKTTYQKLSAGLFTRDKLMIAFSIAYSLMTTQTIYDEKHIQFIIKGPFDESYKILTQVEKDEKEFRKNNKLAEENPKKAKLMSQWQGWMTEKHWEGLEALSRLAPFNSPLVVDHMIMHSAEWDRFINEMDDHANPIVPGPYANYEPNGGAVKSPYQDMIDRRMQEQTKYDQDGVLDIDKILKADDSGDNSDNNSGQEEKKRASSPELPEQSDEEEDVFLKRKNHIDEDEFVSGKVINGLAEYNEFKITKTEIDRTQFNLQQRLTRDLIRFCFMRVFRPDLIVEQVKRYIEIFLDPTFTQIAPFNYHEMMRNTQYDLPNLLICGRDVDSQQELLRIQSIQKKDIHIEYIPLKESNLPDLADQIALAAQQGYWILLDKFDEVIQFWPEIEKFLAQMYGFQKELALKAEREQMERQKLEAKQDNDGIFEEEIDIEKAIEEETQGRPDKRNVLSLRMPNIKDFYVSTAFRIWIVTEKTENLPLSLLFNSTKNVLEPAKGIRLNASKNFNAMNKDYLTVINQDSQPNLKLLYYLITFFHATVMERHKFKANGWNQPYKFSNMDNLISSHVIVNALNETGGDYIKTPICIQYTKYLIGYLIYGGTVTDENDEKVLIALIDQIIQKTPFQSKGYNLTGLKNPGGELGQYTAPQMMSSEGLVSNLQKMPPIDRPEIFGIHQNATLSVINQEGESLLKNIYEFNLLPQEILNQNINMDELRNDDQTESAMMFKKQKVKILDVEVKIPDFILEFEPSEFYDYKQMMLYQESQKYNSLLRAITNRLRNLIKCLDGETLLDSTTEREFNDICMDRTPPKWLAMSFPSSEILPNYLIDLQERVDYIRQLVSSIEEDNKKFWLPGFFCQASFFAMILQHEARQIKIPLDQLTYSYTVFTNKDEVIEGAYCIYGLTIINGIWNRRMKFIEDLPYNNHISSDIMPMIMIEVIPQEKQKLFKLARGKNLAPTRINITQEKLQDGYDLVDGKQQKYFLIPLYITEDKARLPSSLMQGLISHIPVRADNTQITDFWVKRGTCLVCRTKQK